MIYFLSVLLFVFSCKNEKPVNDSADPTIENVVKDNPEESSDISTKSIDTLQAHKKNIVDAEQNETAKPNVPKPKKKEATKSVPKPEPSEVEEKLESVDIKESKEIKSKEEDSKIQDKRIPTPEVKPKKEILEDVSKQKPTVIAESTHSLFDELLKTYVDNQGNVDYVGLISEKSKLQEYLDKLSSLSINGLNRNEKLAFWINAYNAFTIKLITDNYPVSKITELENGKPWDKKWINLDGKTLSLNQIENDIIRPQFKEPRIHFAVNCAAKSCPPLLNKAWTASNLEQNFERQTKAFINNAIYNTIASGKIVLSKIFEWYADDFGNLIAFLNKYSDTQISSSASIDYAEYNWKLNKK